MKKLKLQLDDLAVDSFTTSQAAGPRGTVEAHNTFRGNTCQAVNTCGPQTCLPAWCVIETADPIACGSAGCGSTACPPGTANCPTGGGLSCVGCTTYDYTVDLGDDTCGLCASFGSDAPQRCPCV
jgi:hypothetical protein